MARNLKFYLEKNGINAKRLCEDLGIKQSTFSYWINGKMYPRIDKIEMMANYFGIKKSDLVEEHYEGLDNELLNSIISEVELLSTRNQKHLLQYAKLLREGELNENREER